MFKADLHYLVKTEKCQLVLIEFRDLLRWNLRAKDGLQAT